MRKLTTILDLIDYQELIFLHYINTEQHDNST